MQWNGTNLKTLLNKKNQFLYQIIFFIDVPNYCSSWLIQSTYYYSYWESIDTLNTPLKIVPLEKKMANQVHRQFNGSEFIIKYTLYPYFTRKNGHTMNYTSILCNLKHFKLNSRIKTRKKTGPISTKCTINELFHSVVVFNK